MNDPEPDTNPHPPPPILPYRRPAEREDLNRAPAIRSGCLSVWGLLILAIVVSAFTRGQGFLPVLLLGILPLLAIASSRKATDRHTGFLLGLFFGILTVVGAAFLLLVIVCGGAKWR